MGTILAVGLSMRLAFLPFVGLLGVVCGLVSTLAVASCSQASPEVASASSATVTVVDAGTGPGQLYWIISGTGLGLLDGVDGGTALVDAYFNAPGVFVMTGNAAQVPQKAVQGATFDAVHSFVPSCGDGGPPHIEGIVD